MNSLSKVSSIRRHSALDISRPTTNISLGLSNKNHKIRESYDETSVDRASQTKGDTKHNDLREHIGCEGIII